ncbi:MAG: hypothetical protein R3C97_12550 [Geminicoccaceae bacterium]
MSKAFRKDGIRLATPNGELRGADAESKLEDLLEFDRPGRATKDLAADQMGLSGLFWIDQGTTFAGARPSASDQGKFSDLLSEEIDHVVAGDDGDA